MNTERLPDHELEWEILGYQAMSKTEHSIDTRRVLSLLVELKGIRRLASVAEEVAAQLSLDGSAELSRDSRSVGMTHALQERMRRHAADLRALLEQQAQP